MFQDFRVEKNSLISEKNCFHLAGAGLMVYRCSSVYFYGNNSTISFNTIFADSAAATYVNGAGVYVSSSTDVTFSRTTAISNVVSSGKSELFLQGGAFYFYVSSRISIFGATVESNIIFSKGGDARIMGCGIFGNMVDRLLLANVSISNNRGIMAQIDSLVQTPPFLMRNATRNTQCDAATVIEIPNTSGILAGGTFDAVSCKWLISISSPLNRALGRLKLELSHLEIGSEYSRCNLENLSIVRLPQILGSQDFF